MGVGRTPGAQALGGLAEVRQGVWEIDNESYGMGAGGAGVLTAQAAWKALDSAPSSAGAFPSSSVRIVRWISRYGLEGRAPDAGGPGVGGCGDGKEAVRKVLRHSKFSAIIGSATFNGGRDPRGERPKAERRVNLRVLLGNTSGADPAGQPASKRQQAMNAVNHTGWKWCAVF